MVCLDIMFKGHVDSPNRINLLYGDVERHYHVIVNITGVMAKRFMCKACYKSCTIEATQRCDQTCSDFMVSPPCDFSKYRIPCAEYNRPFTCKAYLANNKQSTSNKKSICECKRCCATCGLLKRSEKHVCSKWYCDTYKQNREVGHLCYKRPLKYVLPDDADKVLYVFIILRPHKIRGIPIRQKNMCPNSSVCNSFVRLVRTWNAT